MKLPPLILVVVICAIIFNQVQAAADDDQVKPEECEFKAEAEFAEKVVEAEKGLRDLPPVFEFAAYVKKFGKQYRSPAEWMNRARWFFVRAHKVFVQGVKFALGKTSKFFRLNAMSDRTPEERLASFGLEPPPPGDARDTESERALAQLKREMSSGRKSRRKRDLHEPLVEKQPTGSQGDQVYLDYRTSGCLAGVKNQGQCGSCYIFATIAMYEYHHCVQTGKLVEFSEQYPVDCGLEYGLKGCAGGRPELVGEFVGNFGLEPRDYYGYKAENRTCPYDIQSDYESMGFTRLTRDSSVINFKGEHLEPEMILYLLENKGPASIAVGINDDFADYGGGVDKLDHAKSISGHAMVLIGHGIEDGREYWLIRNSHGTSWGELGHYKLDKASDLRHIWEIDMIQPHFQLNTKHDIKKVKQALYNNSKLTEKLISWVNPFQSI